MVEAAASQGPTHRVGLHLLLFGLCWPSASPQWYWPMANRIRKPNISNKIMIHYFIGNTHFLGIAHCFGVSKSLLPSLYMGNRANSPSSNERQKENRTLAFCCPSPSHARFPHPCVSCLVPSLGNQPVGQGLHGVVQVTRLLLCCTVTSQGSSVHGGTERDCHASPPQSLIVYKTVNEI